MRINTDNFALPMVNEALISPQSIAVIGGSNHLSKPGGKLLKNILDGRFSGALYVVNPREKVVQGVRSYSSVENLPAVELAILIVPPQPCLNAVEILLRKKTTAFVVISAGFGEAGEEGRFIEQQLASMIEDANACLIGPNCIGVLNMNYHGVFTSPIPTLYANGCDLISSSGATAVFLMEAGILNGLRFSSIFSVGNAAQTSVEDILEYLDNTYVDGKSSPVKLLYLESVKDYKKLIQHAASLIHKGAKIAAIKSGSTEAGSRAAASHTGAMMNSDIGIRALFRKAGIVFCTSREELIAVASVFSYKPLRSKNLAVITHAGGSAVMLTDALTKAGLQVPVIEGPYADDLLGYLNIGASVKNPIDFLATGTAEQLGIIIDFCEHKFDHIDAMVVVFGSPGLFDVANVYNVLRVKLDVCKKPIFPVLPSVINAQTEIANFLGKGHVNFPDEVMLGKALGAVFNTPEPAYRSKKISSKVDSALLSITQNELGFLDTSSCNRLLNHFSIPTLEQVYLQTVEQLHESLDVISFPCAIKVVGPIHKTDVNGVILNVQSRKTLLNTFKQLMRIKGSLGVVIQPMIHGVELFIGATREPGLGHIVLFGFGGIFVEIYKDVQACLVPVQRSEVESLVRKLIGYPLLSGYRGRPGIEIESFIDAVINVSRLLEQMPEVNELDINPLIATPNDQRAVDCRIRINPSMRVNKEMKLKLMVH